MLENAELSPRSYPESKYEGFVGGEAVELYNTLYMVFVYEDGDIIARELLKDVKQYVSHIDLSGAILRTNGDLYIVNGSWPYLADSEDFIRICPGGDDRIYAFTRTGLRIYTKDKRRIAFEYGVVMDDAIIMNTTGIPLWFL